MFNDIYLFVYYAFVITSSILFFISFFTKEAISINTAIAGFFTAIVALLLMMTLILTSINANSTTSANSILQILFSLGPFLFLFFMIVCFLYFLFTYQNAIVNGNVSPSYYTFQNISILIIMLQLFLFTYGTDTRTGKMSKTNTSFIYLLSIINVFILYTIRTILTYFLTDG